MRKLALLFSSILLSVVAMAQSIGGPALPPLLARFLVLFGMRS